MTISEVYILPGLDGHGIYLQKFVAHFEQKVTLIKYPTFLNTFEDYVDYVDQQIDEDCLIIAESFSGPIAAATCQTNKHVRAVCFVATFLEPPRPILLKLVNFIPAKVLETRPPHFMIKYFMCSQEEVIDQVREVHTKLSGKQIKNRLLIINKLTKPASIDLPSLYLQASNDRLIKERSLQEFTEMKSEIRLIEGSHLLLQENPKDCYLAIKNKFFR